MNNNDTDSLQHNMSLLDKLDNYNKVAFQTQEVQEDEIQEEINEVKQIKLILKTKSLHKLTLKSRIADLKANRNQDKELEKSIKSELKKVRKEYDYYKSIYK